VSTIVTEAAPPPAARRRRLSLGPLRAEPRAALVSALTVAGLLLLWWAATRLSLVSPVFLPSPGAVLDKAGTLVTDGYVDATPGEHLRASLGRVLGAFLIAVGLGVPVGLAMGLSPVGRGLFDPVTEFVRPIPPLAYLPLVVIWCGIGEASKVLVIAVAMLAPVAIATAAGVRGTARHRIDAARSLGASPAQVVGLVVLPSALPEILVGLRIALGAGCSTLVAAELVAATRGLGFMIQSAANFLQTEVVLVGIFAIAALAFALEGLIRLAERVLVPWRGRS
jgi:taurine transport system permease protein